MTYSNKTQKFFDLDQSASNQEIIKQVILRYPGLRFHEIKKEVILANGTLQHHLAQLVKGNDVSVKYVEKIPRYYISDIDNERQIILLRLRQRTTSRIIKSLLKNKCQTFSQLVKFSKKSPGTVSVYKNMLLKDGIIAGNTDTCECAKESTKIKYRLTNDELVRTLVNEYGKSSLQKSADNLADIFLSIK